MRKTNRRPSAAASVAEAPIILPFRPRQAREIDEISVTLPPSRLPTTVTIRRYPARQPHEPAEGQVFLGTDDEAREWWCLATASRQAAGA